MTNKEKISKICEIEYEITNRVISDRYFRPSGDDEYSEKRKLLKQLRENLKDVLVPPSSLPGGDPQVPDLSKISKFKNK